MSSNNSDGKTPDLSASKLDGKGWTEKGQGWTEEGQEVVKVSKTIHVGSRESKLALIQTNFVIEQLEKVYGNHDNQKSHDSQKNLFEKSPKPSIQKNNSHPGSQETSSASTQSSSTSTQIDTSSTSTQSSSTSTQIDTSSTSKPSEESDFMEHTSLAFKSMKSRYEFKYVLESMKTIGDKILDRPLPQIGDKGLFTKELEDGLASKSIDLIVHSLKDLPTSLPPGCCIGAVLKRENPQDALVLRNGFMLTDPFDIVRGTNLQLKDSHGNPRHPVIGTSSLRRQSQLRRFNPNVTVTDVRGNITTRLEKLDGEKGDIHFDALVLAVSGLTRAGDGHKERISLALGSEHKWYHAVGQGALAIECREDDEFIHGMLEPLNDYDTIYEILIERSLMSHLEGGCSVPIGVRCSWSTDRRSISVEGSVFSSDGQSVVEDTVTCSLVTDLDDLERHRVHGGKRRKVSSFTGIITPKCPVLLHNFQSCFEAGAELSRLLKAKGAGVILEEIKEEKKRRMDANGNGSANSSFESI